MKIMAVESFQSVKIVENELYCFGMQYERNIKYIPLF